MDRSSLVRILGFPATLIHGDPMVFDRWRWLRRRLPRTANGERLIDVGCGTGAFTIGAAKRGYRALGLSWAQDNQEEAARRAKLCNAEHASFEVLDVRELHSRADLAGQFDIAVCLETIEHVLDDSKLMRDIARCIRPGGRLLLTTPDYLRRPVTRECLGPYSKTEDGGHVRRGYTPEMLHELCNDAGLIVEDFSACAGYLSQKLTGLQWHLASVMSPGSRWLGWAVTLPFRPLILPFDWAITRAFGLRHFSICIEAYKPRHLVKSDG